MTLIEILDYYEDYFGIKDGYDLKRLLFDGILPNGQKIDTTDDTANHRVQQLCNTVYSARDTIERVSKILNTEV